MSEPTIRSWDKATGDSFTVQQTVTVPPSEQPQNPGSLPVGTKIRFLKTICIPACGDHPELLLAEKGDGGEVVAGEPCREGHWVKWDHWKTPFGAQLGVDFEAVNPGGHESTTVVFKNNWDAFGKRQVHPADQPRLNQVSDREAVLIAGLRAVAELIAESRGVAGLHLNGDLAPWDELRTGGQYEEWLQDYDAAMELIGCVSNP